MGCAPPRWAEAEPSREANSAPHSEASGPRWYYGKENWGCLRIELCKGGVRRLHPGKSRRRVHPLSSQVFSWRPRLWRSTKSVSASFPKFSTEGASGRPKLERGRMPPCAAGNSATRADVWACQTHLPKSVLPLCDTADPWLAPGCPAVLHFPAPTVWMRWPGD